MKAFILAAGLAVSAGAARTDPDTAGHGYDPNRIVCRNMHETGSRLALRRVCMTQSEWEEQRRETRQNVDRAQTTRTMPGQ